MRKKWKYIWFLLLAQFVCVSWGAAAQVERRGGRVWIVDRLGDKWEVTEAEKQGFVPEKFRYGIGKDAIVPLGNGAFSESHGHTSGTKRVIGFGQGEEARAVAVGRLARHEILNTEIGGAGVAAAYWPLADLSAVYSREMDGETLTLAPSGWTYKNTFVLYDKESGSLWYPERKGLKAIQGKYLGKTLPEISHADTSWSSWRKANPDSLLADWQGGATWNP